MEVWFFFVPYILSIILLIPVIFNYFKLTGQKYVGIFSVIYMISTTLSLISFYFLSIGYDLGYVLGEMILSLFDLIGGLVLIMGLHRILYIRRLGTEIFLPLPIIPLFTSMVFRDQSIETLNEVIEVLESSSLILLGASMTLYLGSIYFAYQLYKERRGGSTYWLSLSLTVFAIFLSQFSFFVIEVLEGIFLEEKVGIIRYLSMIVRGVFTLIVAISLNILWWFYKTRILPLLEEIKTK